MEYLILAPPVLMPAEPPSGAFTLAAALAGHGREVALLDLSVAFFHRLLDGGSLAGPGSAGALAYLRDRRDGYDPMTHRSATGVLHRRLGGFGDRFPGWKLTLMDVAPPARLHDPAALAVALASGPSPFQALWEDVLDPVLREQRPRSIWISLAYLSQLPATLDLALHLRRQGLDPVVGGSLPRSLAMTGHGLAALAPHLPRIDTGDGSLALAGDLPPGGLLGRLWYPTLLSPAPYLSSRPILPLPLSTGCYHRRCLFCPDRCLDFHRVPTEAVEGFLASLPAEVLAGRPVLHLIDSAVPPGALRRLLPLARARGLSFYGFARPTREWLADGLLAEAAESGCLMLQLGVESGSQALLDRYEKGLDPADAAAVVQAAASAGIRTYLYLLLGLPGETDADREATLRLLTDRPEAVDFLNLSLFNLPRHSELTTRAAEFGVEIQDFPGEDEGIRLYWPFTCHGISPRDEARQFLRSRLLPHPAVRPAQQRTPRWLRAAHLALLQLPGRRDP
jgi:hypothetical protein